MNLLTKQLNVNPDNEKLEEEIEHGIEELSDRNKELILSAQEKRSAMDPELVKQLRRRAKTDLFFLCFGILGYDKLSPNLHGQVCAWLEANKIERFLELLLPRSHYKSTIKTIGGTIQTVLPDDVGDQPHPYNLGTNSRNLIVHEVSKMASGYLFSIIQHFMSNPLLMSLFPECVPTPKRHKINSTELVLPRTKIWNEPTIGAMGLGGRSQGLHYDELILDDLIGEKARDSQTEMDSAKLWFDSIRGFFTSYKEAKFTVVGTRWGADDLYSHIEDRYEGVLKIYRRAIEEPVLDEAGKKVGMQTIFPEQVGPEDLVILKKNPTVFASQYMNDPEGGDTKFDINWLRKFSFSPNGDLVKIHDPEVGTKKVLHISDLNKVLIVDPAITGYAGLVVVGTDYAKRHLVLEAKQEILAPPAMVDRFFELYLKWNFRCLAIEEVLFSELYRHWLESEFKLRGIRFNIFPIKDPKHDAKPARVMGISPLLSAGKVYVDTERTHYTITQDKTKGLSDFEYQVKKFGSIKAYHILDAFANLEQVAMPGYDGAWAEQMRKQEQEKLQGRSNLGYSKIKLKGSGY